MKKPMVILIPLLILIASCKCKDDVLKNISGQILKQSTSEPLSNLDFHVVYTEIANGSSSTGCLRTTNISTFKTDTAGKFSVSFSHDPRGKYSIFDSSSTNLFVSDKDGDIGIIYVTP
ncbi:MAG: hypothetical protein IPI46_00265 [Bacteroidetes bacterium]|nr:hypothetical protein [Bacteroidota bacterium]